MSLTEFDPGIGRAERKFREAFERLKDGRTQIVPKGTKVSQNNVAKEAGVKPSALRRQRFPVLADEIEAWVKAHETDPGQTSQRQKLLSQRTRNRDLRGDIEQIKVQRDDAFSKLVDAEARIVELMIENARLRSFSPANNVTPIRPSKS